MVRVKICCIQSIEEARLAIRAGADALGLVAAMPSGPGVIAEERIATIAASIPPPVATFLLTALRTAPEIAAQHRRCRTSTIQLVDQLEDGGHERLRRELPGIRIVQVVHVRGPESVAEAARLAPCADALLLDSGNPSLAVKELGGTGRVHDWSLSRAIVESAGIPVFLAGGLRPENVSEAIERVGPFGVDVCTGVRTEGRLDAAKLEAFLAAVRRVRV